MRRHLAFACLALAACTTGRQPATTTTTTASAAVVDTGRPRPYRVFETPEFARAVERGTRTRTGRPGPRYWTNYARYRLEARLDPSTKRLTGRGTIRYENRSPDTLRMLALHVAANLFAPGTVRNEEVPITGGITLDRVAAQGATLQRSDDERVPGPAYFLEGTVLWVRPPRAVLPGDTTELAFEWSYVVPPDGAPRTGTDGEIFYVAYWYPQMAVYDDVSRWQSDPYMGNAEFYMGYADYDVSLTVPEGWLVAATGTLQNPEQVLSAQTRERLARARRSGEVVHVVTAGDRGAGRATARATATDGGAGTLTWRYAARNVRDFAWGTSDQYLWDATIAIPADSQALREARGTPGIPPRDTTDIHSFYRPNRVAWAWDHSAEYARHSIEFLSRYLWPYPYPHMTAVDGVTSCSGMEYPMMTCIGGRRDTLGLYSVTVHEFAHMWFPMQVGSDERRYAWQDEGLTRFNQAQAMREYFRGYDLETLAREQYLALARRGGEHVGGEVELMRHGDRYPYGSAAYGQASYSKMASNMVALRALVGDSLFLAAYREYGRRWLGKHPQPFDFWNTFEDVTGRDLDWFWRTWWYETWTLDHAIAGVARDGAESVITVEDRGRAPMPARLTITMEGGRTERREVPVETWLAGARRAEVRVPGVVTAVTLDEGWRFPDIDRSNDRWPRR